MNEVKVIGQMDNSADHTFESANRVYDVRGLCPTIPTGVGGGHTPKILTERAMDGTADFSEKRFFDIYNKREIKAGVCIIITAHGNASSTTCGTVAVAEMETEGKMGGRELKAKFTERGIRIYQDNGKQTAASEFRTFQKTDAVCNSIMAAVPNYIMQDDKDGGLKNECAIVASRGRKDAEDSPYRQRAELNGEGIVNTITHAQKDNMVLELEERRDTQYRIRKLTPRECGRLMGVKDSDIDRMAAVNSNSQLYKQFGNSIVVDVMCAMFRKLNIRGVERHV